MRRVWSRPLVALSTTAAAMLAFGLTDALAAHGPRGAAKASSGFPWETVLLWVAVGVAVLLILAWIVDAGRRRHWHLHRPAHV